MEEIVLLVVVVGEKVKIDILLLEPDQSGRKKFLSR